MNRFVCFVVFLLAYISLAAIAGCGSSPPMATHFSVSAPATATAGSAISFSVTALDAANKATTNYSGTVQFTSTDAKATLPASMKLMNGMGSFPATLNSLGNQTITATDMVNASITGTSGIINVSPGPATHFSVVAPSTVAAQTPFSFTVTAQNASNNVATGYTGTVRFSSTDPLAKLPGNMTLANGTGSFSATLRTIGNQMITATDTVNSSITGSSGAINVRSGQAVHFLVLAPISVTAQKQFTFTVTAQDAEHNTVTGYSGTIHFTSTDNKATLPDNSMLVSGTGSFLATLRTTRTQTITATDTVNASINGTSNSIGVFASCSGQGQKCGTVFFPPCCSNLVCSIEGNRTACQPAESSAEPSEPSRFLATCVMGAAREFHSATLLSDGLVLVTGGDNGRESLSSAELFNFDTHSFTPTSDMTNARARHTETLLPSGAVLIAGGRDTGGHALASAELFDPARTSFAPVGTLNITRESHTATPLADGRVLIAGGDNGSASIASAEIFDPATARFVPTGGMTAPRRFQTATLLKNGEVLVTGGSDALGNVLASAELYDPATGVFSPTGGMNTSRESHTATLLENGMVLIVGGDNGNVGLATAELYDPASGTFSPTGGMHSPRELHTATLRSDGTVLVAGGTNFVSTLDRTNGKRFLEASLASAELFNPSTGSFAPSTLMATSRSMHTATLLPDGTILLTGGINEAILAAPNPISEVLNTAEVFQ
jgi:hypothetical protein